MANSVKVVLIDTRYVQTDATKFKSVVQSLTGKDSSVAWIDQNDKVFAGNNNTTKRKRSPGRDICTVDHSSNKSNVIIGKDDHDRIEFSNNDFDTVLMQPPPLEDLQFWLSDFLDD